MKRHKYYRWLLQYWFYEKFSGTVVDRLYFLFKGELLSLPNGHFPMKYNDSTNEFDLFYTWEEMLRIDTYLKNKV